MKIKYKIIFFALLISLSILSLSWVTYRFLENLQSDYIERIQNHVQALNAADSESGRKTEIIQSIKTMEARIRGGEKALLYVIFGILCFNLWAVFLFSKVVLNPIRKLSILIGHISSGDFVSRVDPVSGNDEFGELYENVLRIKTGLGGILQDVAFLGAQVSGSAEELQSTSEQIVTGMKNQNQKEDFIATALEELNKTIQNVAQNATESFHAAEKMVRFAEDGNQKTTETIDAMDISEVSKETISGSEASLTACKELSMLASELLHRLSVFQVEKRGALG